MSGHNNDQNELTSNTPQDTKEITTAETNGIEANQPPQPTHSPYYPYYTPQFPYYYENDPSGFPAPGTNPPPRPYPNAVPSYMYHTMQYGPPSHHSPTLTGGSSTQSSPQLQPLSPTLSHHSSSSSIHHRSYHRRPHRSPRSIDSDEFSLSPTSTNNVYIRGLPPSTTDESLFNMCSKYGVIISSKAIIDQKRGECKGYGFVLYTSTEEAENAIEDLNTAGFQVSFAKLSSRESFSHKLQDLQDTLSTNLYISNLPAHFGEIELEGLFHPYTIISNRILRDANQVSRGVGFARMSDRESALAIIQKFNGQTLPGSPGPLQVRFADSMAQKKLKGSVVPRRRPIRPPQPNFASYQRPPTVPEHGSPTFYYAPYPIYYGEPSTSGHYPPYPASPQYYPYNPEHQPHFHNPSDPNAASCCANLSPPESNPPESATGSTSSIQLNAPSSDIDDLSNHFQTSVYIDNPSISPTSPTNSGSNHLANNQHHSVHPTPAM